MDDDNNDTLYYSAAIGHCLLIGPGTCGYYFKSLSFKLILHNSNMDICCEIAVRRMPENLEVII